MIDAASLYLANKIKKINPEETPPVNVMRYSIKFILLNFITLPVLLLASGVVIGDLSELLIGAAGFVILRFFSGGFHINNAWACAVTSVLTFHFFVLSAYWINGESQLHWILGLIALGLVIYFSPSNIEKQTKFKKENYKWLKLISVILVSVNLCIIHSDLLTSAFVIQGFTLVTFGRGGEKK